MCRNRERTNVLNSRVDGFRHASLRTWGILGSLALVAILYPISGPLSGQGIHGRVLVHGDLTPVDGATLSLSDAAKTRLLEVQTDSEGFFRLPTPGPGIFGVLVSRIGLSTLELEVRVRDQELVEVEIRMSPEAIPLEPLLVVARREIRQGTLDEFYDRMAQNKNAGKGQFLTKEQIEARSSMELAMLLQTLPGVWLDSSGRSVRLLSSSAMDGTFCEPEYILDGQPMLGGYRRILTMDLEGVEVYRGYSEAVHGYFPNSCGLIFLWRRPDWGNPFTWRRAFLAGGFVSLALLFAVIL